MFTIRRMVMLCVTSLAVVMVFASYFNAPVTPCVAMSGTNLPIDPQLVSGNTDFAFKLYHALATQESSNFVYSPYSVSELLAMLDLGADGQTETQIAKTLSYTLPQAQFHTAFHALDNDLVNNAQNPEGTWCNANALWVDKSYALSPTYLDQVKKLYGSEVQYADFASNPGAASQSINQWVQNQTRDRITNFLPQLNGDTRLVLINAVYFKNNWEIGFPPSATRDAKFTLLDGSTVTVHMMNIDEKRTFSYHLDSAFQILDLPFKGQHVSMTIIMPTAGQFETFESGLDKDEFGRALTSLMPSHIGVALPRFQIQYEAHLTTPLQNMGMTDAFDPNLANFTKMASSSLYVQQAIQKASINVDETGAEAAAVSDGEMYPTLYEPPVTIDHPFIFVIRDKETGAILFIGRELNPLL